MDLETTKHDLLNLNSPLTVTVCSGSSSSHLTSAYIGSKPGVSVNVLTRKPKSWSNVLTIETNNTCWEKKGNINGYVKCITDNPEEIIPQSDIIIIAAPAHTHQLFLSLILPYLKKGVIIGCIYCQGGFNWAIRHVLKEKIKEIDGYFGFQNIPWVCRTIEYGHSVRMCGLKKNLMLAAYPKHHALHYSIILKLLLDLDIEILPNFLSLTLTPSNQIIHPARYYTLFKNYDGITPIQKSNLPEKLYASFDDPSESLLLQLDHELQLIRKTLKELSPELDLTHVLPIHDRLCNQYQIPKHLSLKEVFQQNTAYATCNIPLDIVNDEYVKPLITSRLFWEDIPCGLCVLKGIAEIIDLNTPVINQVILWHQKLMNKNFLLETTFKLNPLLIKETGAPQAYGIFDIQSLLKDN